MRICDSQSWYLNSYNSIQSMWWLKYYVIDYKGHHELNINVLTLAIDQLELLHDWKTKVSEDCTYSKNLGDTGS